MNVLFVIICSPQFLRIVYHPHFFWLLDYVIFFIFEICVISNSVIIFFDHKVDSYGTWPDAAQTELYLLKVGRNIFHVIFCSVKIMK